MDNAVKDQEKTLPPLVTVLMSVYNGEDFLAKAIESILGQTFKDFEFLIINDGSRDNSWPILKEYSENHDFIKIINFKRNYGQTASINAGIQYASGDIIVLIDSDLENDPNDIPQLILS